MGLIKSIEGALGAGQQEETFKAYSLPDSVRERIAAEEVEQVKGFDEIAGLDPLLRQKLYQWRFELRNSDPEKVPLKFKSILFSGPPGVGKTMLADALIKEAGETAEKFDVDKIAAEKGWSTDKPDPIFEAILARSVELSTEDSKRNKLRSKKTNRRLIVFMDEADRFFRKRTGEDDTTGKAITYWNQLMSRDNIWIIGMTNHPEFMSKAVFSRFTEKVTVRIPDPSALIDLFAYYIALIDFEARKQKRQPFDEVLMDKVNDYRDMAAEYMEYMNNHPTSDPENDATLKKKIHQFGDKAKALATTLGPVLKDANGLTQRDIADVMMILAQEHHIALSRKEARDEMGMTSMDVEGITLDDIRKALAYRRMQNAEYDAAVQESLTLRRGRVA